MTKDDFAALIEQAKQAAKEGDDVLSELLSELEEAEDEFDFDEASAKFKLPYVSEAELETLDATYEDELLSDGRDTY
jgi:hypothetical protein